MEFKEITQEEIDVILEELKNENYIIEEVLQDKETYNKIYDHVYSFMIRAFEVEKVRKHPIYFKFKRDDEDIYSLSLNHFITNLTLWEGFLKFDAVEDMGPDCIVNCEDYVNKTTEDFYNEKLLERYGRRIDNETRCKTLADITYKLAKISSDFDIIMGITLNIELFMDLADKNKEIEELMRPNLDINKQPYEIEEEVTRIRNRFIELIGNEDNILKYTIATGSGINTKQLAEFACVGGLKPSLDGKTIPVPINSNFLVGGLGNVRNYFIDASGLIGSLC